MIYFKCDKLTCPATIAVQAKDHGWDERETRLITVMLSHADAAEIFADGLTWAIQQKEDVPVMDENGLATGKKKTITKEIDQSDFCVAGTITDNRDGTVTCKMGRQTASDMLAELEAIYDAG